MNTVTHKTSTATHHHVDCGWVPGTSDRVRLGSRSDRRAEVVVSLREFHLIAGRDAVDALYLQGRARIECDDDLWTVIAGTRGAVR
jgi:hypothetical protein